MPMEISEGKWRISIADDNLSAKLLLEAPEEGGIYSPQEILAFLRKSGVTHGLIYSEVEDMVQKHIYYLKPSPSGLVLLQDFSNFQTYLWTEDV